MGLFIAMPIIYKQSGPWGRPVFHVAGPVWLPLQFTYLFLVEKGFKVAVH